MATRSASRRSTRKTASDAVAKTTDAFTGVRAFRGLALVFALSFLSLLSILLVMPFIGGLPGWTRWQFAGLFGVIEAGAGLYCILAPNIWRLPVAASRSDERIRLAPGIVLIPHWGAAARFAAGVVLMVAVAVHEGVAPSIATMPVLVVLIAALLTALSLLAARPGVARPDLDVVQFVIRQPKRELTLEPFSIGAVVVQFLLGICTVPLVHVMASSSLYRPGLGVSWPLLAITAALTAPAMLAAWWWWRSRIDWHAPAGQQREADSQA